MGPRPGGVNRVRLIGGRCRGRNIHFPDAPGLRPSGDRVRETLFNWLQPVIAGAACLDLFAGSGALGFEAASRGAGRVVLVEREPRVAGALRQNRAELALEAVVVVEADALSWLERTEERFDLLFLDPPFGQQSLPRVFAILERRELLKPGAQVYLEASAGEPLPPLPVGLHLKRDQRAGRVRYALAALERGK